MPGYREIIEEIEGMIRARGLSLELEEVVIDPRDGDLHPDQHPFVEYRVAGPNGDIHIYQYLTYAQIAKSELRERIQQHSGIFPAEETLPALGHSLV